MNTIIRSIIIPAWALTIVACASPGDESVQSTEAISGTAWELVRIQSMDDRSWSPEDPSGYTLTFDPDGTACMRLDCNRGRAGWSSEQPGRLEFGPRTDVHE